ncbi:putative transporter [Wickerhamomyces ciferrii]|uniref:Transporter n=1 Tax=Wickerhamomyces ciferrii (strain ATCC 14091 / BCRC 22168 / CBS 111 / JCM 3599 / NBRC 0793 / NRRL Y-1031 F-60-10) TaxID=1206466 RepID=K0KVM4_WICCF|nr:putative transporter [Wickerhamomyces ciferrii]CCH45529.1 putative transporter [Wickerhamomyces ciferrii]
MTEIDSKLNSKIEISSIDDNDQSSTSFNKVKKAVEQDGFYTYEEEKRLLRKIDLRLMPLLILLYLCKNLDVNNISYIITMNKDTGHNVLKQLNMTRDDWAWTSTIYYIPFILFEIPSTILMKKTSPRVHQFRISFLWGIATICHAAVKNKQGLYGLRFALGLFEAGQFPGSLLHLCYFYRPDEVTTRMAFLGVLGSFSSILTAFITYGFSFTSGNVGNLSGWQWVYISEGAFTIISSIIILYYLPNYPDSVNWLTEEEKSYIIARLPPQSPKSTDEDFKFKDLIESLKSKILWGFSGVKVFQILGTYGLSFWLPSIIQDFGLSDPAKAPLLSIPSATASVISGIYFSYLVDRSYFPPGLLCFVSLIVSLIAFIILTTVQIKGVLYAFIIFATCSSAADGSVLTSWLGQSMEGSSKVGFAFSFANSIAQLGGILGAQIFRSKYAPRYTIPYAICLSFIGVAAILVIYLWYITRDTTNKFMRERRQRLKQRNANLQAKPIYNHSEFQ